MREFYVCTVPQAPTLVHIVACATTTRMNANQRAQAVLEGRLTNKRELDTSWKHRANLPKKQVVRTAHENSYTKLPPTFRRIYYREIIHVEQRKQDKTRDTRARDQAAKSETRQTEKSRDRRRQRVRPRPPHLHRTNERISSIDFSLTDHTASPKTALAPVITSPTWSPVASA